MTKLLHKKFTFTAMAAITVLILVIIIGINAVTVYSTSARAWENLRMIVLAQGDAEKVPRTVPAVPENAPRQAPPDTSFKMKPNQYDTFMSLNFFTVRFDGEGEVTAADVRRTSAVSETDAADLAKGVLDSGSTEGRNGRYFYHISDDGDGGRLAVFLDITDGVRFSLTVLVVSTVIGLICWVLMLPVTNLMSKRAIVPIAENIEKQKQFVTNAGHEIKTPLAIIMSNTEALELYLGESKWSRNIKAQTQRLSLLMRELLSLARTDEGGENRVLCDVDMSECLESTLEGFSMLIEDRGLEAHIAVSEGIHLKADRSDCEKLCSVLIDNAVKYADDKGRLNVSLVSEGRGALLSVENTCSELPEVPAEKLFDRFYRYDRARTQKTGGCGIGLSIAQSVCTLYGWKICGEYPGENTVRFEVRLER